MNVQNSDCCGYVPTGAPYKGDKMRTVTAKIKYVVIHCPL